ncbi:GDP-L-fucose synthase [uncultured archaeon]|nr:GDP-L-fucose synthase [uncultured archaeon]
MKVLITGSNGFIGKYVTEELLRKKHKVIEYDFVKKKNLFNKHDLITEMKNTDAVIHLAGMLEGNAREMWKLNVEGTRHVAEAAQKTKQKKLVFMSSTGVYGLTKGKVDEESEIHPENTYEKSKAAGERICMEVCGEMEVCIVRSAMVFGANNYWRRMFGLLREKYPLPCSGKNHFQIIYVKELAQAIVKVLEKGKNGEIYLIAGKEKPTLNEFCEIIQVELGLKKGIKHMPTFISLIIGKLFGIKALTAENVRHLSKERNYDTRKIEKLGWSQKITLEKAMKEVVKDIGIKKE